MKAAIIDDEVRDQDRLAECFKRIRAELKEPMEVQKFLSGEEFLRAKDDSFDLICLDIDMKGKNGIQIAKEIRKNNTQVFIIFITNMAQMAIRGYEVQAFDFILKPVNYFSFSMKIKNLANLVNSRKTKKIIITTENGMRRITTDELRYVEVNGHYLYYHTGNEVLKKKMTMKDAEKELEQYSFCRCNNCYLVNLKYVECVERDDVNVGGVWLKISRPRKKEFLQALANYMEKNGRILESDILYGTAYSGVSGIYDACGKETSFLFADRIVFGNIYRRNFLLQYDLWNPGGRNCVFYLLGGVYCRCSAVLLEWIKGSGIGSGLLHDLCCGNAAYSF